MGTSYMPGSPVRSPNQVACGGRDIHQGGVFGGNEIMKPIYHGDREVLI
jgi:hypothetical protein